MAQVGIIMGSQSDWPTMRKAAEVLDALGVAYETRIVSAHRTPDRLVEYAKTAKARGLFIQPRPGMLAAAVAPRTEGPPRS